MKGISTIFHRISLLSLVVGTVLSGSAGVAHAAGDASIILPDLGGPLMVLGHETSGHNLLWASMVIAIAGIAFGWVEFRRIRAMPAHPSMREISSLIYETCKAYLLQQAKFLFWLHLIIAVCIVYYFFFLLGEPVQKVVLIFIWSVIGVLGSVGVSWFGMRINNYANSRAAFASLRREPFPVIEIPLRAGMSVGMLLICVELILLISVLLFMPAAYAGGCFVGFAIGESLGASVLRVCGGIFTKIADIGADLMKIVFRIKEDDARNPGVIADCVGDNAGDSVGPTADGFETYGVTAVALISFIVLAVGKHLVPGSAEPTVLPIASSLQATFILWVFALCGVTILSCLISYEIVIRTYAKKFKGIESCDFEEPLSVLIWVCCVVSLFCTFGVSYALLAHLGGNIWWVLGVIVNCGTLAATLLPELTKVFTSSKSKHVAEIVDASREGGASLTILSGLVAGNFSAFWKGLLMAGLMFIAFHVARFGLQDIMIFPAVFAFGLLAFGFLAMAPVTIAVDGYGPVTDNAQSVFELSQIEEIPGISAEIERDFGFKPDFERGKLYLEQNDSAGNTFKATAKPVLIGTAVIGSTTLIFSIILLLKLELNLIDPHVLLGVMLGGATIYWFSGASMQAVVTGAYRAVEYIKANIKLDTNHRASVSDSKEVVRICTRFAQDGMFNIFGGVFCLTLAYACFDPEFFAAYLISIATFGLYQAMFMANAGGAWDNAKKVVEVDLKKKGSELHAATVVGDTVGDPFKDTSSVALNPIIKFTTLFGLLAVQIAASSGPSAVWIGAISFVIGLVFVGRSFYRMRITATS